MRQAAFPPNMWATIARVRAARGDRAGAEQARVSHRIERMAGQVRAAQTRRDYDMEGLFLVREGQGKGGTS